MLSHPRNLGLPFASMLSGRFRGGSELEGPGESLLVIRGGTGVAVVFEARAVYLCIINTFYFYFSEMHNHCDYFHRHAY